MTNENSKYYNYIVLFASILALLFSFILKIKGQGLSIPIASGINIPETCIFKIYTGQKCLTCGLSRGFTAISHGDFTTALIFNRGALIAYLLVAFQIPYRSIILTTQKSVKFTLALQKVNLYLTIITIFTLVLSWFLATLTSFQLSKIYQLYGSFIYIYYFIIYN